MCFSQIFSRISDSVAPGAAEPAVRVLEPGVGIVLNNDLVAKLSHVRRFQQRFVRKHVSSRAGSIVPRRKTHVPGSGMACLATANSNAMGTRIFLFGTLNL